MKHRISKRLSVLLTILALLLLIIPAGTLFADSIKGRENEPGCDKATIDVQDNEGEDPEETEESGEASEQAGIAAERIAAARALGIPPGQLNLIDKLAEVSGKTREELLPVWQEGSAKAIMAEIKRCRFEAMGKEMPQPQNPADEETTETGAETSGRGQKHGQGNGHSK